jgi:V/A-type H+-transporting ATPase subunit I
MDRVLILLPLEEHGGSVTNLFYFFGFTLALGVVLNSIGLKINLVNQLSLKNYGNALFTKTGLAGIILFWYALFITIRFVVAMINPEKFSFNFSNFDLLGLLIPLVVILLYPTLERLITGKRPVFADGFMTFFMETFVGILDNVSGMLSSTLSFLRIGAFALSHAVLAFIVFYFFEMLSTSPAGTLAGILILILGNTIIIALEGLIVSIQVVRLHYYEFFSKFFTEMGVQFTPFRFRKTQ